VSPAARAVAYLPAAAVVAVSWLLTSAASNDFFQFWFAGHLVATGRSPYDQELWASAHLAFGGLAETVRVNCPVAGAPACLWAYPPWTAWALAPLGALGAPLGIWVERAGFALLLALGALLVVEAAGIARLWVRGLLLAGSLASAPFVRDLLTGHFDGALLVGLALTAAGLRRGSALALSGGAVLLALKPHLFLVLAALVVGFLVARGNGRLALAPAALLVGLAAIGLAAEPGAVDAALGGPSKIGLTGSSTWSFAERTSGPLAPLTASLLLVAAAGAALVAIRRSIEDRAWTLVAAGAALTIVAAPYVQSYDHVVLLPCLAASVANVSRGRPPLRDVAAAAIVAGFLALTWGAYLLELRGDPRAFAALIPVVALAVLATTRSVSAPSDTGPRPSGDRWTAAAG
jgi:hypothetical protein